MASRNVSGHVDENDSDQEVTSLTSGHERTSRGPKVVNYGDRMPYRQGTVVIIQLNTRT